MSIKEWFKNLTAEKPRELINVGQVSVLLYCDNDVTRVSTWQGTCFWSGFHDAPIVRTARDRVEHCLRHHKWIELDGGTYLAVSTIRTWEFDRRTEKEHWLVPK